MLVGKLITLPNAYSRFGQIKNADGVAYTVEPSQIPKDAKQGDTFAYKVEIWENDSGIAYNLEEN